MMNIIDPKIIVWCDFSSEAEKHLIEPSNFDISMSIV